MQITKWMPGGLPLAMVDPNGVITTLTYDARLHLLSSTTATAAGPLTTAWSYDAAEQPVSATLADGSIVSRAFDAAHRLTGVMNQFGEAIAYTLDAAGDRMMTSVLDANGNPQRTRTGQFDALGRLHQDTAGAGQTTIYDYDSNSNLVTLTAPLARVTQRAFDALNRLVKTTDAAKGIAAATYDNLGRVLSATDPIGGVTSYVYDGFGELIQRVSPDSGSTVYRYNSDGQPAQVVDATGATVNYAYDALGRTTSATYPADAAENVTYTYDEPGTGFNVGRLTSVTDAAGSLSRNYDERGNVINETRVVNGVTLMTAYSYDAVNRIASITYPSGLAVAYTHDAMGQITTVNALVPGASAAVPIVLSVQYQPFGPINSLHFGNGITGTRGFDLDYRVTSIVDAGIQNLAYKYDAANNVMSSNSQTLGYDPLNRLTNSTGDYGSLAFSYDANGNRRTDSAASYAYAPKSNQLTAYGSQTVAYTKAGSISSFSPALGSISSVNYNQAGQLATVSAGANQVAQYTYDAFGHRLVRVGALTANTLYTYDRFGHLLEQSGGDGSPLVDYIYLNGVPVATISPLAGTVYYLHTDRLGTPEYATDSSQTVQWSAAYQPFGSTSAVPGGIVQDLRLPGQEFDVETGWYHNGFRDYVPAWGRYLQSDPAGLNGGFNTYAYANGNPLGETDFLGLEAAQSPLEASDQIHQGIEITSWVRGQEIPGAAEAGKILKPLQIVTGIASGLTADDKDIRNFIDQGQAPWNFNPFEGLAILWNLYNQLSQVPPTQPFYITCPKDPDYYADWSLTDLTTLLTTYQTQMQTESDQANAQGQGYYNPLLKQTIETLQKAILNNQTRAHQILNQ